MADSILRLRVESDEYDSKIKRAQQGLLHMEEACRKVGGTLSVLEKEEKDFVQSLGSMETVSKTARGRLSELTAAFTELSMQYKRLTDEEKRGDFGKALSSSLEQLKTRIFETKNQLADTNRELNGTPSLFDQLTSRLTVNIDAVKLFNVGLQAAGAALDVAKNAFFQSESNIDEWGRTVEGAKGAYEVFLNALNTGNWSNFFNNLSKAIQGGRDLYDALDRLGSIKSNNQAAIALVQAQIQQLRVLKQQGKDVDDEIKSATQRLKELQGQSVRAGKVAGRTEIVNTLRNEVAGRNTTGVQIDDRQLRAASQRVLNEGQAYFDGMAKLVRQYEGNTKYQTTRTTYTQTGSTIGGSKAVDVTEFDLSKLSKQQQQQYLIAKAITEGETRIQVGISTFAQAVQEGAQSAREEFRGNRYAASGSGGGGGGGNSGSNAPEVFPEGSLKQLQQEMKGLQDAQALVTSPEEWQNYQTQIDEVSKRIDHLKGKVADVELFPNLDVTSDALSPLDSLKEKIATSLADAAAQVDETTISTLMRTVIANGIDGLDLDFSSLQEMMAEGLDIPDEKFQELQAKINEQLQAMGLEPINIDFKTGEIGKEVVKTANDTNKAWQAAAQAISSAGSAMQNMEDPAAKVAGIVMQAIANIALGFSKQSIEAAGGGPFAWIAATLSGLAVMTATIAQIKSATKGGFASGGIVPGNSFSGDNLHTADYGINAGELILSRSQQYAVASQLEGNSVQGGSSQPYVNAETIFLGVNNYLRREGRGEIVTSKSR